VVNPENQSVEKPEPRAGFSGSLSDMGVVDLVQTFELGRKTGTIRLETQRAGWIYLREGKVVDAEVGRIIGEKAFYRLLGAVEGTFEVTFSTVARPEQIALSTQALLMEGIRRLDEWSRLLEQLPPLDSVLEVDYQQLAARLFEIPDEIDGLLRLFDGRRNLGAVLEDTELDDLETLAVVSKLFFAGLIRQVQANSDPPTDKDLALQTWLSAPLPSSAAPAQPDETGVPLLSPKLPAALDAVAEHLAIAEPEIPEALQPRRQASETSSAAAAGPSTSSSPASEPGSWFENEPPTHPPLFAAFAVEKRASRSRRVLVTAVALLAIGALGVAVSKKFEQGWPDSKLAVQHERATFSRPKAETTTPAPPSTAPALPPTPVADLAPVQVPVLAQPEPTTNVDEGGSEQPGDEYAQLMQRAALAARQHRYKTAALEYRHALELHPDSGEAKASLGIALVQSDPGLRGYREAIKLLQEALQVEETNSKAWLALGMAFQFTDQRTKAVEAYKRYLVLEPRGKVSTEVRAMLKQTDF